MEKKQEITLSKKDREDLRRSVEYIAKQLDLMVKTMQIAADTIAKAITSIDWEEMSKKFKIELEKEKKDE